MAFQGLVGILLCAVLASAQETFVEQQQIALDKIAEQLRKDYGFTGCTAPQLATCGTEICSGSSCGTFRIRFTSAKEIYCLIVFMKKNSEVFHFSPPKINTTRKRGKLFIGNTAGKRHFPEPSVKYDKVKFIIVTSTFHHRWPHTSHPCSSV